MSHLNQLLNISSRFVAGLMCLLFSLQSFGQQHYPIKNMLRANVHEWDIMVSDPDFNNNPALRTANMQKSFLDAGFTGVRIYVDVAASKADDNSYYQLSPNRRGWRVDSGLLMLRQKGIYVLYTYQGAPKNFQTEYDNAGKKNTAFVRYGDDRLNPASWAAEGHDIYVLASRGGTNPNVPDYPIYTPNNTWETRETMYKGAGFINAIDPNNEPDNLWVTIAMNGYEIATMGSVVYDSAKKADPNMTVSSAGVASDDTVLLSQALDWSRQHGGKKFCDTWQFHSYASGMWQYNNNIASGLPPEPTIIKQAKKVVTLAAKNNLPAFIGEWGYDKNPRSWLSTLPFSNYTGEEVRCYWSLRAILGFAASGIESAYYYKPYQDYGAINDSNETVFASCGTQYMDNTTGIATRTLTGDAIKQTTAIGDFVFDKAIIDNDTVKLYQFKNGISYLYTGWTVEKIGEISLWGANRAQFTERKFSYNFNVSGTRFDINEDSSGVFKQQPFYGGTVELSSKPFFIVSTTILPIKDTPKPTPKPKPHQKYNVEVYRLRDGFKIMDKKNVDIDELKAGLPMYQHLVVKYWNNSYNYVEKIFKTNQ